MKKFVAMLVVVVIMLTAIIVLVSAASACTHQNAFKIGAWGVWRCNDCYGWFDSDPRVCQHKNVKVDNDVWAAFGGGAAKVTCQDCGKWWWE